MANTVSKTVSDDTLNRIIQIESAGNPTIKAKTSSALGLGQFIKKTWRDLVAKHEPEWAEGLSDSALLACRTDPHKSIEMLARLAEDNKAIIGAKATPGDLYLAHFAGAGTAKKICKASADTPVVDIIGITAVEANTTVLEGKTCGEVRAWAADKMKNKTPRQDWVAEFYEEPEAEDAQTDTDVDDDTDEDAPADVTPHGKTDAKIKKLQQDLDDMGYHEVGIINGRWGGGTKGALAAFLNDRGIDTAVGMTPATLREIEKAKNEKPEPFYRPVSEARANVTPKELAPHNETVKQGLRGKATAFWGGIVTFVTGVVTTIMDKFSDYWHALATPRKILSDVPIITWFILVIVGCAAVWYFNNRTVEDTTQKFRDRKLLQ